VGDKWKLLEVFADRIRKVKPNVVSMENVPSLATFRKGTVFQNFVAELETSGYQTTTYPKVYCPDYGIPQERTRLVFFASLHGRVELEPAICPPEQYETVKKTIGHLDPIGAGQVSERDPLHKASSLSDLNMRRMKASVPGGNWRNWPSELVTECHKKETGKWYSNIYGRMKWDSLAPTITTQCYGFGNGRFGHPEQDRAISMREAALLQSFPPGYEFVAPGDPIYFKVVARHIGNAVPVELGRAIARSIRHHVVMYICSDTRR
jgi:DNA (cytosine-5)-methyltransferase 1